MIVNLLFAHKTHNLLIIYFFTSRVIEEFRVNIRYNLKIYSLDLILSNMDGPGINDFNKLSNSKFDTYFST